MQQYIEMLLYCNILQYHTDTADLGNRYIALCNILHYIANASGNAKLIKHSISMIQTGWLVSTDKIKIAIN